MIDTASLDELIEQQIKIAVDQRVQALMEQTDWAEQLEKRIVKYAQDRIVGRFANISTIPDLIQTVQHSVGELFAQGRIPDLASFVDKEKITAVIDSGIQELITAAIDNLVVDPEWVAKVERMTNQNMAERLTRKLSEVDLDSLIVSNIDSGIDRWQEKFKKNFHTAGIRDQATKNELTVVDDAVVVESMLATKTLYVDKDAEVKGSLTVDNFIIRGTVNTDNKSWDGLASVIADKVLDKTTAEWKDSLVQQVLDIAKETGIDFAAITLGGKPVIDNGILNPSVTESNLHTLGVLKQLIVAGNAKFGDTMHITGRRVGINTENPEMALSVWDEEVTVIAGKLSPQQAYLGTARLQNLAIGINRIPQLEIDTNGLTTIKQLRVGRHRISHANEVPGYSGTRGDFVFNTNPSDTAPFAWVCLGSFQWKPLFSK